MTYRFKPLPELYWGVVIAASTVLLMELVGLNPDAISDWRGWAVALAAGTVRAAAGAALDYIRRSMAADPEPTLADQILALSPAERASLGDEVASRGAHPPPAPPAWSDPHRDVRLS